MILDPENFYKYNSDEKKKLLDDQWKWGMNWENLGSHEEVYDVRTTVLNANKIRIVMATVHY